MNIYEAIISIFVLGIALADQLIRLPLVNYDTDEEIFDEFKVLSELNAEEGNSSSVQLTSFVKFGFFGQISIGARSQLFKVSFDTASSVIWVPSKLCTSTYCTLRNNYDYDESSSYQSMHKILELEYGMGLINGTLVLDNCTIAGIQIENQTFVSAHEITSQNVINSLIDGSLGLGLTPPDQPQLIPVFVNMLNQNHIKEPVFSVTLNKGSPLGVGGEIVFGGTDKNHYIGNFTYAPAIDNPVGIWLIHMDKVEIHGNFSTFCDGGCEASIDTGTSLIMGPLDELTKLNKELGAETLPSGKIALGCGTMLSKPNITFVISNSQFTLSPSEYMFPDIRLGPDMCLSGFKAVNDSNQKAWILGVVFLRKFYTAFNFVNKTVGFAEAVITSMED